MELHVYTDGGSKGNPGPAAIGLVVYDGPRPESHRYETTPSDNEIIRYREDIGTGTNNEAEYTGIIRALEKIKEYLDEHSDVKIERIRFFADSELVVKQLNGEYKVKQPHIRDLIFRVRVAESDLHTMITFTHVRREENKLADALVNDAA